MDKNVNEMQDLFNSELMTSSIPVSNPNYLYINNQNFLKENKNYKEDIINKESNEIKESKTSSLSKAFDINNKIFSDDDMSLNKSSKLLIKQNSANNKNNEINNKNTDTSNSFLLSLNINEIQLEENYDIKKIIPADIYNYIRYSGNQLINNTKEGLKKLFIYLSDSLNNQKKINGSNDYYYNNDLNSENLLKIYIYIINIINKNEAKHDIINESLFIINLILPLLPTMYINNICLQLIEKFYCKTAFDDLSKNNYLLFKQILRLNNSNFFDKIFVLLKKEKNLKIKLFWKKFILDLIQKNNENCGIDFYFENNENIINILSENHKDKLVEFCLGLFNYDDLNEINSNKDALELIKCISNNKILNNENNIDKDNIAFDEMILERTKDNETLNILIKTVLNKKEIKKLNTISFNKNNLNSGSYFQGSFDTFNANKKNFIQQQNENNFASFNNYKESLEKYKNNDIFEVMDNNIIYEDQEQNNEIDLKLLNKKLKKNNKADLNEDNLYLYSDKEEESSNKNLIINNNNNIRDESLTNYKNNKNSIDSVVNYKFSTSNKEIIDGKNNEKKKEKKSITNNNKNVSKRTSKISEYYEYFNKRSTTNNNLFSSFSSFSSAKRNSNDIKINNLNNDNINNENNNNFNNSENKENEEINNINRLSNNKIEFNNNNDINKANDNIINNDNFLNLINNKNKSNINIEKKEIINNKNKIIKKAQYNEKPPSFEKKGFDFENCLNIIDKEKWNEKQQQIKLLKNELNIKLSKDNYNKSEIPMDSIINLINKKLNDKQQKLVILILEVVEIIVNKLNEIFNEEYLPLLSQSIINNLNDNNIQLRYKAATVILKILVYNKKDFFINQLIESLKIDKNNMRIEILTILTNYFTSAEYSSSKKIHKNYFELLIEPLILCIEDKINKIRNLSEELIKESTKFISIDKYYEAIRHLYSKVVQDKVNSKIREIYGLEVNNDLKKSDVSINSINDYVKDLNKNKKNKERSKSADIGINFNNNNSNNNTNNKNYVKKNVTKTNKNNEHSKINSNVKINQKNISENKTNNDFDYKNVFKTNQNFIELKNYRNNKDIKLGKNFLSIKEKSNILLNNPNSNIPKNNSTSELKPLFQIFSTDFINKCIMPFNKDLSQIISQINKVLLNIPQKSIKSDFMSNLDIILEFIIRLFEQNLINKNFNFIKEYISLINNIYEKISILNIKLSQIEYNMILHSLIFLEKYDKNNISNCLKKFGKLISNEKLFRILFDYNDLNDIETQKFIVELFLDEFNKGNIELNNDNVIFVKKIIKFFYNDDLIDIGKDFFKNIYNKIGDKNLEEIISKLNKQEKNILMKNIDFLFLQLQEKDKIKIQKKKNNISNFKIDLSEMIENENNSNNNKDKNNLNIPPKNNSLPSKNEIIALLNELNSRSDEFNIEMYNTENDKNNNEILINKFNLISRLKETFEENNYQKNKNVIINSIDLILDSLSKEINYFFNLNTMIEDCANNIINYTQEIISIFHIISSKQEIVSILNENILNKLIILFLNYLEIDKEEEISEINDTFNDILKKINKITLNIIQKGKRDNIIIILIKLVSNFKEESDMSFLAINCLVQLIKITNFKKLNVIDILTEIIIAVDDDNLFNENNNKKINELFLKSIKKLLNQLVVQKKFNILKDYQKAINRCNINDKKVSNWIQKILEHNKF